MPTTLIDNCTVWTAQASGDSVDDLPKEFDDVNSNAGLALFVFFSIYFPATSIWWWLRREHPWLRRRSFFLMICTGLGVFCLVIATALRSFVGRQEFPCDLHLFFVSFMIPLGAGGLVTRLILVYNWWRYSQLLLRTGAVHSAHGFQPMGRCESIKAVLDFFILRKREMEKVLFQDSRTVTATKAKKTQLAGEGGSGARVVPSMALSVASGMSAASGTSGTTSGGLQSDEAKEMAARTIQALFSVTRPWIAYVLMSGFVCLGFIAIGIVMSTNESPYGFKGCTGCNVDTAGIFSIGGVLLLCVLLGMFLLFKVRDMSDSLGLVAEIKLLFAAGLATVAGSALAVADPGRLRHEGHAEWLYISVVAGFVLHFLQCPLQVLRTYQEDRSARRWTVAYNRSNPRPQPSGEPRKIRMPLFSSKQLLAQKSSAVENVDIGNTSMSEVNVEETQPSSDGDLDLEKGMNDEDLPTLRDVLQTKKGRNVFKSYLCTEFSVENLYFLEACEKFRELHNAESDLEELQAAAKELYSVFVKEGCMLEVNLSGQIKKAIVQRLENLGEDELPPLDLFDEAFDEIYKLLANDSFPRFYRSPMFKNWKSSV